MSARCEVTAAPPASGRAPSGLGWPALLPSWRSGRMAPRHPRGGTSPTPEALELARRVQRGDLCAHTAGGAA